MIGADGQPIIWDGVYRSFSETGCVGSQLDHPEWLSKSEAAARLELECLNAGKPSPSLFQARTTLLPIVVSLLAQETELRVLDFGGGPGTSYFALRAATAGEAQFSIDVVETPSMCELTQRNLPSLPGLRLLDKMPAKPARYDVVQAASSLHYVDDWRGLLTLFAALDPKYLIMTELTAGPIESFVTTQRYYDGAIPVRFWSLDELCETLAALGFRPILKLPHMPLVRGVQGPPPMDNFPRERRLETFVNLLFKRTRR